MPCRSTPFIALGIASLATAALAQTTPDAADLLRGVAAAPVTDAMLREPDPADWLMYSRTYDAQRYSPLDEINRGNVASLARAWSKPLSAGPLEIIPLVHRGVMYLTTPGSRDGGSRVVALNAATGATLWEYVPPDTASSRIKALAIYDDMIYYTAPAPSGEPNAVIALDAATGTVRWKTPVTVETHTAGAIVVDGKVISGRACNTSRSNCYIAAHDAAHRQGSVALLHEPRCRRARRRVVGRQGRRRAARGGLGTARFLRSRAAARLLGHRQPNAEHPRRPARRQCRCDPAPRTGRPLQQLDGRAASRHRRARLALPASARRRLGHGHQRGKDSDPHGRRSRSAARQMDQPERAERRRARRRDHGRRRRRRLAQRPRNRPVPVGDAVSVRHGAFHSREHRRRDRHRAHQLEACCSTSPARRSSCATGMRAASGRRRTRRKRTRCTFRTSITA